VRRRLDPPVNGRLSGASIGTVPERDPLCQPDGELILWTEIMREERTIRAWLKGMLKLALRVHYDECLVIEKSAPRW
jgi:hypothetical protein